MWMPEIHYKNTVTMIQVLRDDMLVPEYFIYNLSTGEPAMPCSAWLQIFENYLLVIEAMGCLARQKTESCTASLSRCRGTTDFLLIATYNDAKDALKADYVSQKLHTTPSSGLTTIRSCWLVAQ